MNSPVKRTMSDDEPAPIPAAIKELLPSFEDCGNAQCSDHHYSAGHIEQMVSKESPLLLKASPATREHNRQVVRNPKRTGKDTSWPVAACRDCHRLSVVVSLHRLECGHTLCHGCLVNAARNFYQTMENSKTRKAITKVLITGDGWRISADEAVYTPVKQDCLEVARNYIDDGFFKAQATCCNTRIDFTEFLQCLEPKDACSVWLAAEEMQCISEDSIQYRCGWPDCKKYLPAQFMWDGGDRCFGHCISCGGNSKEQGDGSRGLMCPAR